MMEGPFGVQLPAVCTDKGWNAKKKVVQ